MVIRVVDEYNSGGHLIFCDNLTGAFVRGKTRDEALKKLPDEVARYLRWAGGECGGFEIEVVQEKLSGLQICDADSDVIFDSELAPLTETEYAAIKALALKSARDFLALYSSIPDKDGTVLERRKTFYGDMPVTAREMYEHTKSVNSYYFGEIGLDVGSGPDILACRKEGFALLEARPRFPNNPVSIGAGDERWSLRKVCRRFVWHDRIHARALYRMAARLCGADKIDDPFFFGEQL